MLVISEAMTLDTKELIEFSKRYILPLLRFKSYFFHLGSAAGHFS